MTDLPDIKIIKDQPILNVSMTSPGVKVGRAAPSVNVQASGPAGPAGPAGGVDLTTNLVLIFEGALI